MKELLVSKQRRTELRRVVEGLGDGELGAKREKDERLEGPPRGPMVQPSGHGGPRQRAGGMEPPGPAPRTRWGVPLPRGLTAWGAKQRP